MRTGDLVMIKLPKSGIDICPMLERFDGQIMVVETVRKYHAKEDFIVELEDCKSDKGIPYSFLGRWVITS